MCVRVCVLVHSMLMAPVGVHCCGDGCWWDMSKTFGRVRTSCVYERRQVPKPLNQLVLCMPPGEAINRHHRKTKKETDNQQVSQHSQEEGALRQ